MNDEGIKRVIELIIELSLEIKNNKSEPIYYILRGKMRKELGDNLGSEKDYAKAKELEIAMIQSQYEDNNTIEPNDVKTSIKKKEKDPYSVPTPLIQPERKA